jgi:hypothetical protein
VASLLAISLGDILKTRARLFCSISAKNLNNIDITMEWLVKHAKNPSS